MHLVLPCRLRSVKLALIALMTYGCVILLKSSYNLRERLFGATPNRGIEPVDGHLGHESLSKMPQLSGMDVNLTLVELLVAKYSFDLNKTLPQGEGHDAWAVAEKWVTNNEILPEYAPELGGVLNAMATAPIVYIGRTNGGQQPKFNITLRGGQIALFKPKWLKMEKEWKADLCSMFDSPFGEIAAFHLSRLLEFRKTPLAVGRTLNVNKEIIPLLSKQVPNKFYQRGNKTCFFFDCPSCKKENSLCLNDTMEGVVVLWLPRNITLNIRNINHPWGRPCQKKTLDQLYLEENYCARVRQNYPFNITGFFLDFIDATIFQYLTTNADRFIFQLYEGDSVVDKMMVMLDNGKSFQHPDRDEPLVLAPLFQCCFVRHTTYQRLQLLQKGVLSRVMKAVLSADPLRPVLTDKHLNALDRRLQHVIYEIHKCVKTHGSKNVFSL